MTIQMPFEPKGIIPACLLPFDVNMEIDEASFRSHLRDLTAVEGISAITLNAHSMEVHALSLEEQARTMEVAMDEIGDQIPLVHGVYADGSANAARIAKQAAALWTEASEKYGGDRDQLEVAKLWEEGSEVVLKKES